MSEDRDQAPSQIRRQQAREQGLVARSADLTAAAGLLAAAVLLGVWGKPLAVGLITILRGPLLSSDPGAAVSLDSVVGQFRHALLAVAGPLGGILLGIGVTMLVTHQIQVGGLWVPGLIAPNPARLWSGSGGLGDVTGKLGRAAWSIVKVIVIAVVVLWSGSRHAGGLDRLAGLEAADLAGAAVSLVLDLARTLAFAALGLGALDFLLAWRRVEAQLGQSADEHREDVKALDGDPAIRARRRALALSWRQDAGSILPGAALCLGGHAGVIVVLGGGPPPRPVTVRGILRGTSASRMKPEAARIGIPFVEAPELVHHFATSRSALPSPLAERLARLWPNPSS